MIPSSQSNFWDVKVLTAVIPENSIRLESRGEAESGHHET
jgi:hypothetical protein